jgi:NhaP-type Na+/H+ or K+/H+ antiporter
LSHDTILAVAAIALLGAACQWLAWRLRLPAILFLLLTGILIGPVAGWLDPDALLGPLLFPFVSLAVAVILFEGSLTLRFSEIRGLEGVVRRFVTGGVLVTWAVAALAVVFGAFAVANATTEESGLLAVTAMGIYLGNRKGVPIDEILEFKESLSLLLITVLFILLAARLDLAGLQALGWAVAGVFLAIQLIARPLEVLYCTWGSSLSWGERGLLAWIAPRGIVAAAVSALFALALEQRGFEQAGLLVPLAFAVIIGTVVLQSLTGAPLARLLKASAPEATGFLIQGANPLGRALGAALHREGIAVLICDSLWDNVRRARMAGLRAYYGNLLSEHAETYLDTTGLGRLLAVTPDAHLNALACTRYKGIFGPGRVFALRVAAPAGRSARREAARPGRTAFGEEISYADLSLRLYRGA